MFKSIKGYSVTDKRVLVRCDFNVPIDPSAGSGQNLRILDDFKIKQALPTIKYLIEQKAKIILMSHLDPESTGVADKKYTLDQVAGRLADMLNMSVEKEDDCVGVEVEEQSNKLASGKILLLENLRFYKEEKDNNVDFAKKLSYLGDIYVNDAFATCHRDAASITSVPKLLPSCAGFLLEKEIEAMSKILNGAEKPIVAVVGGKKVETKAKFIDNISKIADSVIVSGLIAKEVADRGIKFEFPEKIIIPTGQLDALDINDESVKIICDKITGAKTVLWNGPFGKFENKEYEKGTLAIAKAIIDSKAFSVVGGGETIEFLNKKGIIDKFSWVSTGGGAMLAYLSGDKLPGLEALG